MYLGLDIGTTSVCAVVLDENGNIVFSKTLPNDSAVQGRDHEKLQNAEKIFNACFALYKEAVNSFPLKSAGISNQMHGILYVGDRADAVSPLVTWQDGRGDLKRKTLSYAKELSAITSYSMATGFGATTLFYDTENGAVPENAKRICTVGDYIAMRLCKKHEPVMHESNAHSIGLYDLERHCWDAFAVRKANMDLSLFPKAEKDATVYGKTAEGVSVYVAVGDNQASVYGAEKSADTAIVNIGTGSQISVVVPKIVTPPKGCELRPYFNGKYLLIGGALCGGYSYQLLKNFYNSLTEQFGIEISYDMMNAMAEKAENMPVPVADTRFKGTRENPASAAAFTSVTAQNFNAPALTLAVLKGISAELKEFYDGILSVTERRSVLVGSGNAIRMNPVLRKILSADYGMKLLVPAHREEAAFGAALVAAERQENKSLKHLIRYKNI